MHQRLADPKVDVIHSGVVLDVTVHSVTIYRYEIVDAYREALRKIAGSDPGRDPKKWAAWLSRIQLAEKGNGQAKPTVTKKG